MVLNIGESVSPQADPGRMARPQVKLGVVGTQSVQGSATNDLHIPKSWEIFPS